VLAVVGLSIVTTYVLSHTMRLKLVMLAFVSVLTTQILAGFLLALLRSKTGQPVHDAQSWIAHYLAYFNVIVFWLLCPIFSGPVSVFLVLWLKREKSSEE